jgi:hypothetical protein
MLLCRAWVATVAARAAAARSRAYSPLASVNQPASAACPL